MADLRVIFSITKRCLLGADRGPFLKGPVVTGPETLFSVCRVYIRGRDINIFEIQTIKVSGNETEWSGFELLPLYYSLQLI